MVDCIHTESDLDAALANLVKADPRFGGALALAGRPPLRRRADGFAGLAQIVVSQQLSTASAKAIWDRLAAALDPFDHVAMLRARKLVYVPSGNRKAHTVIVTAAGAAGGPGPDTPACAASESFPSSSSSAALPQPESMQH